MAIRANRSREDQALLYGAPPVLTAEHTRTLLDLLTSSLNWSELVAQADRHAVVPLLYRHVCALPVQVPREALDALAQRARACLARNLQLQNQLLRLLDLFNRAGLPVMPLKGLYVGSLLYDDPWLRPTSDLDLLVQPADLPAIDRILVEAGWRMLPPDQQGADYHVSYASVDGGTIVEVHTDLGEAYVSGLDVQAVWKSASPATWEGRTIWTMALPDLFLYLCLHAVKDGLASLRSVLDITLFLERFGRELSWDAVARRIAARGIQSPLYLSLIQCRDLLEAPLSDQFLEAIRPRRSVSWFCGQVLFQWCGGLLHTPPSLLTGPVSALQMFLWEDTVRGKLRHLRRNLLPSARLRARWSSNPDASPIRWYPSWIWTVCRHFLQQVAIRSLFRSAGSTRS